MNPTPTPIDWATTAQICGGAAVCLVALAILAGLFSDRRKKP